MRKHDGKGQQDIDTSTALAVMNAETQVAETAQMQQSERERSIANAHETAGIIKALNFVGKVVTVTSLVQLDKVKKSKGYKGIGTWDEYCEYTHLDRHSVDQQLLSLNTFGQEFLETVTSFGVGYREMRRLRQLSNDGAITIIDNCVEIAGESIPLDPEHKEDLQAAIERVLDEKAELLEDARATVKAKDRVLDSKSEVIKKQEKELRKLSRESASRDLPPAEDAFIQRMENIRIGFDGYLLKADPDFVMNEFNDLGEVTPRMRAAMISTLAYMKMQILTAYDTAVTSYGDPTMMPETMADFDAWEQKQ